MSNEKLCLPTGDSCAAYANIMSSEQADGHKNDDIVTDMKPPLLYKIYSNSCIKVKQYCCCSPYYRGKSLLKSI